ncbi:MAG: hypothetical protein OXM55_06300 [Bdellovibrionales bacterium]|nr:hypothetical protein [Bdellovibrionales bacterium]
MVDSQKNRRKHRSRAHSRSSRSKSDVRSRSRSYSSSSSQRRASAPPGKRVVKSQKNSSILFPALFVALSVIAFFYLSQDKKTPTSDSRLIEQPGKKLTVEERIKQKEMEIKLKQDVESQKAISEKFKEPVGEVELLEPGLSPLDMGVHFPDNSNIKEVFDKISEKPFENDKYEDPEDVVRRQIAHQEWLEEYLAERNASEKREFIQKFVQAAREQGYNVYFTKDMKAILEPIDPDEIKKEQFDEVKINWK